MLCFVRIYVLHACFDIWFSFLLIAEVIVFMKIGTIVVAALVGVMLVGCNDKVAEPNAADKSQTAATEEASTAAVASELSAFAGDVAALPASQLCALDAVNGLGASNNVFSVAAGAPIALEGWVSTTSLTSTDRATVVLARAEGSFKLSGAAGGARADVAEAYHSEALANSGFKLEVPALSVDAGDYTLFVLHDEAGQSIACSTGLKLAVR